MRVLIITRHKHGHHDTTVEERTAPAVTHENITKAKHEDIQKVVDKEVHQDRKPASLSPSNLLTHSSPDYHTSVQPVQDKRVLPEEHHHTAAPVEHREHHHGDSSGVKARLEQEAAQFKDQRTQAATQHTQSTSPTVGGEHRHHHVHETIQPVIERQTVQPSVVHTTVPVHETHHAAAEHHRGETLPAITMDQYKGQAGGHVGGERVVRDGFEGEPQGWVGGHGANKSSLHDGVHDTGSHGVATGSGTGASTTTGHTGKKPTFMDKLNPTKDTDGDGKKGILE